MSEVAAPLAESDGNPAPARSRRQPLPGRRALVALPVVAALPVVIFAVIVVVLFDREQRRVIEQQLVHYARSAVQTADLILTSRMAMLQSLSAVAEEGDVEGFRRLAERLLERQGDWLYFSLARPLGGEAMALQSRPGIVVPAAAGGFSLPRGDDDEYTAAFAMVTRDGRQVPAVLLRKSAGTGDEFVLTAALDATPFSAALVGQGVPDQWIAAILEPGYRIVGRSRAQTEFVGSEATPSLVSEIAATDEKFFYSLNKEGERVYTAFSTSPMTGWTAAVGAPAGLIEAPLRRTAYATIGGGAAAMVLALLLGGILVRNVSERHGAERRLLELESEARAEQRLSEIAANFPGVIYRRTMDPAGNISFPYLSAGAERLVGPDMRERMRGPVAFEELLSSAVHPEDQARWRESLLQSSATLQTHDVEGRLRTPDGGVRWVRSTASTSRTADGAVVWDGVVLDITALKEAEAALREQTRRLEAINRINTSLTAELNLDRLVQAITEASTQLSGAKFGAFFYNVTAPEGDSYALYTLHGAPREAFQRFPMPRNTAVFGPTFNGEGIVRSDDITKDPRYGRNEPYRGMPKGHLPVRSYLAVPVTSRSGETIGGLFFGHPEPGVFGAGAEEIVAAIAAQAAIAVDNARLYRQAEQEIEARRRTEEHQALLLAELNHRVKNTLAVVLAIAQQTLKHSPSAEVFNAAFQGRLQALARAHTVLTEGNWTTARLRTLIDEALAPHVAADSGRISIAGPDVIVPPKPALALSLVMHELATNALKYGALSSAAGRVAVSWQPCEPESICLEWQEEGGPSVGTPAGHGFGSKLIEINVRHELGGSIETEFRQTGFHCRLVLPWDPASRQLTPYRE
ncbi:MAG TPA: HWE histidine kinase domain-containing protein [Afifellaceae bacterium]|nr:HWE histidine kinase domain-containing protein [Afifellaceae bacterium]